MEVVSRNLRGNRNFFMRAFLLVVLSAAFGSNMFAQTTASIKGTVSDASGAVIAGAKIVVKNSALGIERDIASNSEGYYEVPALPPGSYSIEVRVQGFQHALAKEVTLEVSQNAVQNFSLQIASSDSIITVESTQAIIESTTMSVGQVIDQKVVQEIPLNGRHFVDLALLIPGTVTPPQNGFLTAPLRGQGSFAFNTAGNREDTVNFLVNGINLNDMSQNQITFQPSISTVSEFKVDNSTYSAEYGRNSGAIVNIATRSGTNDYHGELFEFFRSNALDARNFFNVVGVPQSPFVRNSFGGNFGGPIRKDKTFVFGSYEGLRQRQGITINTPVLTAAQRQTVLTSNNPTSVKLLGLIPSGNDVTGNNFLGSATAPVNIDQSTVDISHNVNNNIRAHGYYVFQRDHRQEPVLQGNSLPGFGDTRQSHRQIATFALSQTISPSLVNEARLGFNRIHITFTPNSLLNPADFGIANGINAPSGLPQISIGGTGINFGGPQGFPSGRGDTTAVFADTLNYLRGKHSFKFGGEYRRFYYNQINGDDGLLTFLNAADFANGQPNGFALSPGNNPSKIVIPALGFFAQDSWKIVPRLTLELGLRYEWNATPTEAKNRFVNFIPSTDSLVQVASPYQQNNKNFEPRVGFAWDIFGTGKTVLRSGYGFLTDQPIGGLVAGLTNNPPLGNPLNFVSTVAKPRTTYATLLTDARASGLAPIVVDPNFKNSYVQSYNLNLQQEISSRFAVMVGYFGSKGTDLRTRVNLNQFVNGVRPFATLSASSPILPGAAIGNISDNTSIGNSRYNALWVSSNMHLWHGVQFNGSYTYSKSIDYTSQNGLGVVIQDRTNPAGDRGLSDFDVRNRFAINLIYALPIRGNRLIEGWQLGTIVQSQSGNPVNIQASAAGSAGLTGFATLRPDLIGPIQLVNQPVPGSLNIQYFANSVCDPAKGPCSTGTTFAIPDSIVGGKTQFHLGNFGRNVIIGPGFSNVDLSLIKKTQITERLRTEFRAEAFDLFNHPNFGQPNRFAQVGSATFGQISNTRFANGDFGSSRQLQLSLKLVF